ncbi:MAG: Peptidase family [Verrucomicrobiota bacterium]|jgi:ABC-type bacteriocin/lantibiotic exporter with double-glycine peptidase domain
MTIVQQLTPFTCGLACIESVCADFGRPKKQEDLLREFKNELIADIKDIGVFGATSLGLMVHILQKQGFTVQACEDHRPEIQQEVFEKIDLTKRAIIITAHFNLDAWHSVRFAGMKKQDDVIFVVDPSFGTAGISEHSISNLIKWKYKFLMIS